MAIIVDNTVTSINYSGSDIATAYIGANLVYQALPPTVVSTRKLNEAVSTSTDSVFKRTRTPLVGTVTDISAAGDKSVLFQNNRWYSRHSVVRLEEICKDLFQNCGYLTHIDMRGFDSSMVIDARWMFYNLPNIVEIDVSEMDTSKVQLMVAMFAVKYGEPLSHFVNVKFGPKFVPTGLSNLTLTSANSTYVMFGGPVPETDPNYKYQIKKSWNPNNWAMIKYESGGDLSWVYTSNSV